MTLKSNLLVLCINYQYEAQTNTLKSEHKKRGVKNTPLQGRLMGLEPTTLGTTSRCSNQLSYNLRLESITNLSLISYFKKYKMRNY